MYVVSYICPACDTIHELYYSNTPNMAEHAIEAFQHTSHPFCPCGRINEPFNLIITKQDGCYVEVMVGKLAPIIEVA
jgi:hypothetical protein